MFNVHFSVNFCSSNILDPESWVWLTVSAMGCSFLFYESFPCWISNPWICFVAPPPQPVPTRTAASSSFALPRPAGWMASTVFSGKLSMAWTLSRPSKVLDPSREPPDPRSWLPLLVSSKQGRSFIRWWWNPGLPSKKWINLFSQQKCSQSFFGEGWPRHYLSMNGMLCCEAVDSIYWKMIRSRILYLGELESLLHFRIIVVKCNILLL